MQMKKTYKDDQSYFQDRAQAKRKKVQDMYKSMMDNPLYQKEGNQMDDDERWSAQYRVITSKGTAVQ